MDKNGSHFTNFKIHSQYSICEGAVKIDELAEYCKKKCSQKMENPTRIKKRYGKLSRKS